MSKNTLSDETKSGNIDVPSTTDDMERLAEWEYGDELYGTFSQSLDGWNRYIEDMIKAQGAEDDYYNGNVIYVNTFKKVSEELDKLK